ncbi:hypothetical protein ACPA9J_04250 [Pseudomonas aeruginosa]
MTCSSAFSRLPTHPPSCHRPGLSASRTQRHRSDGEAAGRAGKGEGSACAPDLRRTPFQGRRTPAPGARPVPRPATGGAARPPAACRQRPAGRGRALVPRERGADSRTYDYPGAVAATSALREWRGRPRRGRAGPGAGVSGGRLADELVQVAHAADVPLMLAYRPLSAP